VIVLIIASGTVGLMKRCIRILLQEAPAHINTVRIRKALMKVEGVLDIHDFHVWQLTDTKIVSSLHVVCLSDTDFMKMSDTMKLKLYSFGIHNTTVTSRGK